MGAGFLYVERRLGRHLRCCPEVHHLRMMVILVVAFVVLVQSGWGHPCCLLVVVGLGNYLIVQFSDVRPSRVLLLDQL